MVKTSLNFSEFHHTPSFLPPLLLDGLYSTRTDSSRFQGSNYSERSLGLQSGLRGQQLLEVALGLDRSRYLTTLGLLGCFRLDSSFELEVLGLCTTLAVPLLLLMCQSFLYFYLMIHPSQD